MQPQGLCSPWNSPGQNTGVGSLSRLQQIFPTQEEDQGLLHCRRILYQLSHQGRPSIRKRPQNLNQNDPSLLNLKGNNTCSSLNRDGRCGAVVFKHLHPHKQDLKAIIHQLCDLKQVTQCLWSHLFIWKAHVDWTKSLVPSIQTLCGSLTECAKMSSLKRALVS